LCRFGIRLPPLMMGWESDIQCFSILLIRTVLHKHHMHAYTYSAPGLTPQIQISHILVSCPLDEINPSYTSTHTSMNTLEQLQRRRPIFLRLYVQRWHQINPEPFGLLLMQRVHLARKLRTAVRLEGLVCRDAHVRHGGKFWANS